MSELEERLRKAITQAAERGFDCFQLKSSRGDSNCPHPVTYSPKDGHGFEQESVYFDVDSDADYSVIGFFDDEIKCEDALITLCRAFEAFPPITERESID